MSICVLAGNVENDEQAQILAAHLSLPVQRAYSQQQHWKQLAKQLGADNPDLKGVLLVENKGLSLLPVNFPEPLAPVYIDFTSPAWQRRLFNISPKRELAAKALGLGVKKAPQHHVLDACAGLGQDLFVFAALGTKVTAFERSPLVYHLLQDALTRAGQVPALKPVVSNIDLYWQDAVNGFDNLLETGITAVYLDPMFPEKKRHASVKKEMSLLQSLLHEDDDAELLFNRALDFLEGANSCSRLVLKRPKLAPVFLEQGLSLQQKGNATRFDIYFQKSSE